MKMHIVLEIDGGCTTRMDPTALSCVLGHSSRSDFQALMITLGALQKRGAKARARGFSVHSARRCSRVWGLVVPLTAPESACLCCSSVCSSQARSPIKYGSKCSHRKCESQSNGKGKREDRREPNLNILGRQGKHPCLAPPRASQRLQVQAAPFYGESHPDLPCCS